MPRNTAIWTLVSLYFVAEDVGSVESDFSFITLVFYELCKIVVHDMAATPPPERALVEEF